MDARAGFPYNKLQVRTLYLQVMDYDRFCRDDPIGEVCVPLSDVDLLRGETLYKTLQPCKGHTVSLKVGRLTTPHVPRTHYTFDDKRFAAAHPRYMWNNLP